MTAGQDPGKLKRQVHLHALPVGWEQLDYATFLERRRSLMAQVVQEGSPPCGVRPQAATTRINR